MSSDPDAFDVEGWLDEREDYPYRDKEILESYLRNGYNYKEIGDVMCVSGSTIRNWAIEHELEHLHPDAAEGEGPADRD